MSHAPRRPGHTPEGPVSLRAMADELLEQARELDAGRSGRTLTPGTGTATKQTLLALTGGQVLQEHRTPGPATIQMLRGRAVLGLPDTEETLEEGTWTAIPDEPHDLEAVTDTVALLTVSAPSGGSQGRGSTLS